VFTILCYKLYLVWTILHLFLVSYLMDCLVMPLNCSYQRGYLDLKSTGHLCFHTWCFENVNRVCTIRRLIWNSRNFQEFFRVMNSKKLRISRSLNNYSIFESTIRQCESHRPSVAFTFENQVFQVNLNQAWLDCDMPCKRNRTYAKKEDLYSAGIRSLTPQCQYIRVSQKCPLGI